MIINKMTASFGKLNGDSLSFHEGLNVVCAPNESGKSTWCAFIRAMLYGVDSSERVKNGHLPDKLHYLPWSGAPMQGSMELNADGRDIELRRTTRLKNAPMREFAAVYAGTNVPIEGLNTSNAGEALTGVSRDVFRRSAFVEQGGIGVTASPELEKRIATIVSTGEEGCSYSEADERLRAWQRKRRYNRRGYLPELEGNMALCESKLRELHGFSAEQERLQGELEDSRCRCESLEEQMIESRKSARKDALASLHDIRSECSAAQSEYDAAKQQSEQSIRELSSSPISNMDGTIGKDRFEADRKSIEASLKISEQRIGRLPAVMLIVLAVLLAAVGLAFSAYAFIGTAICAIAAVLLFVGYGKKEKESAAAAKDAKALLLLYGATDIDEAERNFEEYLRLKKRCEDSKNALELSERKLNAANQRRERTEAETLDILDFNDGGSTAALLGRRLAAERSERDRLSARLSELKGRAAVMGDPLVIGSKLNEMRDSYREISGEYEAIALALDALKAADTEIQSRFSPELGRKAAEYFSFMTDGKYDALMINRDFGVCVRESGGSAAVDTAYLSAGAQDLMYLAVRLAVCELALPKDKSCPLILDDTLSNLDNERSERAMKLLKEISKTRQVILFTCREI